MGAWTVGRVSLDDGSAPNPGMSWDGDSLSFSGQLIADTQAELTALRDQVQGLANNRDEPVVPVTWADDSTVDGFYRVLSASVKASSGAAYSSFWLDFQIDLERVPGWQAPLVEIVCRGALRVNTHSVTNGTVTSWTAAPNTATYVRVGTTLTSEDALPLANGDDVRRIVGRNADLSYFYDAEPTYHVTAADFYDGAATITVGGNTVVGRQISNDPDGWVLSNGLIRCNPDGDGLLTVEVWDDTAGSWDAKQFDISVAASAFTAAPDTVTVLRNSPEVAAVRVNDGGVNWDITLRRGVRYIEFFVDLPATAAWSVLADPAEAASSTTAGMVATSDDAAGNKYVVLSPEAVTLTGDSLSKTSSVTKVGTFMIGMELDGTSAATRDDLASMRNRYFAAMGHSQVIAAR